jgi:hypothetical protein
MCEEILKQLGMNPMPASQRYKRHTGRWKRYDKQRPGHHVQIDVKFIEPIATGSGRRKRYYQYTAIDDCTRLRVPRAYPRSDQKTAIQFLDYVLSRLPFQVEKIQTDNGAEFQSSFRWHVLDQGIGRSAMSSCRPADEPEVLAKAGLLDVERALRASCAAVVTTAQARAVTRVAMDVGASPRPTAGSVG